MGEAGLSATEVGKEISEHQEHNPSGELTDHDRRVTTVLLATVLFLVGISGHFRVRAARYGLVGVGAAIMLVAFTIILFSPRPPA